jgi:uncharacterized protein
VTDRSVALVTGASVGIGAVFARVLAEHGHDLVMVARDVVRLEEAAEPARAAGADVEVLPADLGTDAGCQRVTDRLAEDGRLVRLLVNNAGVGIYEPFGERSLTDEERLLDLNVRAVLRLTHAAVRGMTSRGGGEIVNVSSVASLLPRGIGATYAASKAWVTSFSECLSQQLAGTGVRITAVCPGFVHTEFHQRAGIDRSKLPDWMWVDAEEVVRTALADVRRGKPVTVPGPRWKAVMGLARCTPRPALRRIMRGRSL